MSVNSSDLIDFVCGIRIFFICLDLFWSIEDVRVSSNPLSPMFDLIIVFLRIIIFSVDKKLSFFSLLGCRAMKVFICINKIIVNTDEIFFSVGDFISISFFENSFIVVSFFSLNSGLGTSTSPLRSDSFSKIQKYFTISTITYSHIN